MSDWFPTTIGEVITLQRGFDITKAVQRPGEIPVVSSGGISSFHDTAITDGPGVVMGRKGTLGKVFYLPGPYWPHDTTLWVKDFKSNSPRFVYYFLQTLDFLAMDVGSSNPTLNRNHVHPLPVLWPSRVEQEAIAHVLGALDDKIAVNDRIAATARQLNIDLFVSAIQDSSENKRIQDIAGFLNRGQAPKYADDESCIVVVNQKCVRDGRVSLEPARRAQADRVKADRILRRGDVLVNSTGVGTLGRVGIWSHDIAATVDSHVTIVRVDAALPAIVGAFAVLGAEQQFESLGEGSTGQTELSRAKLASVMVRVPKGDLDELAARLSAVETRADAALNESQSLAKLRDTLLPELLSGRLRVKDAEKIVEEAN
ncbi:restriction endonuclease subunit S [Micromonospora sp. NPDC006766]|uniref:restriction endonuclease subunit S n=1 Tax=Micromonospora sp. NPDC006766 TaxID=3154778 RepID=UPI0033E6E9D2